jgi:predicted DsbA family dithiol-disulfide isomerase
MIKLDIFSDPICPWCYIGKTTLDRALESRPNHPFEIEWHPYQLNPDMPEGGMDRHLYLEMKFGGKSGAVQAYAPVIDSAEAAGLDLNMNAIAKTPNTMNAHRLIHWAGLEERQNAMVAALFRAYFKDGKDLGDFDDLADIAESAGLDRAATLRLLATDADAQDIRSRDSHARARGISGVPCFIIANTHVITGAQSNEFWQHVIEELTQGTGAE